MRSQDFAGKTKVISVTPSLDTPVCDAQLRRFNDGRRRLGDHVAVLNVSMDLPFAIGPVLQHRWHRQGGTLSDHRDASFGLGYGVLIKELRLLARAVFVVDEDAWCATRRSCRRSRARRTTTRLSRRRRRSDCSRPRGSGIGGGRFRPRARPR